MKTIKLCWLLPLACLTACGNAGNHEKYLAKQESGTQSVTTDSLENASALGSPDRKIIRTADFTCKVQNVLNTVNELEGIVTAAGGIVQESQVANTAGEVKILQYKPDSLRRAQAYTTTATLTLRVPSARLDSLVRRIPALAVFMDSRTLRQTDVTARSIGNELKTATGTKVYTPQKGVQLARKTEDLVRLQEYEDGKQEKLIDRKVENMLLMDDVRYATITVVLSQAEQVFIQTVIDPEYATREPFATRFMLGINSGWQGVLALFIAIATTWPLILLSIGAWMCYRYFFKSRRLHFGKANVS